MKPIIVIGHAALDYVYRIEAFPPEPTKVRALEHVECGGGMAANAAAAIARLGGSVELWSRTGSDEAGHKIRAGLDAVGVGTRWVKEIPGARSSTSAVIVDGRGERLIVGERDHAMSLDASWLPYDAIETAAAVLTDLKWIEAASAAFLAARAAGVPTIADIDLGAGSFGEAVLPLTDYAIFSGPALDLHTPGADDAARLAGLLAAHPGLRHVGVTRGAAGYRWQSRDGSHGVQPAFPITPLDTTGAGDAFHGAFTLAIAEGQDAAAAARFAAGAAALSCRSLGARAGLPTRAELAAFLTTNAG